MKKSALSVCVSLMFSAVCYGQSTIAQWTFETSQPGVVSGPASPGAGVWITNIAAEAGSGTASGFHAGAATYSSPSGNGSARSFSVNTWAVGDLFQFVVSTIGRTNIGVSFDHTSSTSGPGRFDFAYSTDGSSFTPFVSSYIVPSNAAPNAVWNSTTASSIYSFSFDLSAVTALNNAATAYFRVVDSSTASSGGGTPSAAGTSRLDNFTVVSSVPEPGTLSLLVLGGSLAVIALRRKR